MILHNDKEFFQDLISNTSTHFNITEAYIEKDYWICYALKQLSKSKYNDMIVFKGGTSLSKAYKIIERFSEDIDLQLINFKDSDSQKKKLMKEIELAMTKELTPVKNDNRESKRGSIRKTIYDYSKIVKTQNFGVASSELIIEINSMSIPEPSLKKNILTYIAEYLNTIDKSEFIIDYALQEFELNVLDERRTFVEKIFAVLDFSFAENNLEQLAKNIRHIYDIHKLYREFHIKNFTNDAFFYKMSNRVVVENDFFGNRKATKYIDSVLFDIDVLDKISNYYYKTFSSLVFGNLPDFALIKEDMKQVLEKVRIWEIEHRN